MCTASRLLPDTAMRSILDFLADVDRKRWEKITCETITS